MGELKDLLQFTPNGLYCPQADVYIDPWTPVNKAIITHAHSDHARSGNLHYLSHRLSAPIMKHRLGADIQVQTVDYAQPININGVKVSLHPAGHVIGSAQVRLEYQGLIVVVSGDYKMTDDQLSTPFEPVPCHTFVTESTFGLPIYRWMAQDKLYHQMQNWVADNKRKNRTSVFIAYSLGKAQRVMKALEGVGKIYVHKSIGNINELFEQNGIKLPNYEVINEDTNLKSLSGEIVIFPPALEGTTLMKKIPNAAIAACSGWMQVRGNRRWKSLDSGFAISDHADWPGLLSAISQCGCEQVFVTHGYTATFSRYLNENGLSAAEVQTKFGEEHDEITTIDQIKSE